MAVKKIGTRFSCYFLDSGYIDDISVLILLSLVGDMVCHDLSSVSRLCEGAMVLVLLTDCLVSHVAH